MITQFGLLLVGLAIAKVLTGGGAELASASGAAAWLARTALLLLAGFALAELGWIGTARFSDRARSRFDRRFYAALHRAADRLPADRRQAYVREWEGELHEILQGPPVARVWRALRYVVGLRRAAPAIARVLDPDRRDGRLRSAGRGLRLFALSVALVPVVTAVLVVFVGLTVTGMLLVAVWAAAVTVGTGRRATFRQTFVKGCRRSGLCLFGWPAAADSPGEKTLLSL